MTTQEASVYSSDKYLYAYKAYNRNNDDKKAVICHENSYTFKQLFLDNLELTNELLKDGIRIYG